MTKINLNTFRIHSNMVLVKLDGDHETYHNTETGQNTGIFVPPWGANAASHVSLTGVVIKCPERFIFSGARLKNLKGQLAYSTDQKKSNVPAKEMSEMAKYNRSSLQADIAHARSQSLSYDVPMEVQPGDRVYFEYVTRLDAEKEGRRLEMPDGVYLLIHYDLLVMKFKPGCNPDDVQLNDIYPLNGIVIIKCLEYATEANTDGIRGAKTEQDLFLPQGSHKDARYVHKGNAWYATVLSMGCRVDGYADFPATGGDVWTEVKPGMKIMFDGRQKKRLEVEHHRVIFKKWTLHRIHRKDILSVFPDGNVNGVAK